MHRQQDSIPSLSPIPGKNITLYVVQEWNRLNVISSLKNWVSNNPPFTKFVLILSVVLYIWSKFNENLHEGLVHDPYYVVYYRQWYRLFSSPLTNDSLVYLILIVPVFVKECRYYETEWGTLMTVADFIYKNALVNLILIDYELDMYPKHFEKRHLIWRNYGLWSVTFTYIIERCYRQPMGNSYIYSFKDPIRNIYFGMVLFFMSYIVNRGFRIADIIAVLLGLAHAHIVNTYFNSSRHKIKSITNKLFPITSSVHNRYSTKEHISEFDMLNTTS